ncbi:MAG: hypothetical protein ACOC56_02975 [Atribacterota bacterium]
MKIFKRFFNNKKKTETQEEEKKVPEEKEITTLKDSEGYYICDSCGFHIIPEEHGQRTFNGKKYHKKCLRKIRKQTEKQLFN